MRIVETIKKTKKLKGTVSLILINISAITWPTKRKECEGIRDGIHYR